jgi:hypothetical protein
MRNPFSTAPGDRREPASAYHEPTPAGQTLANSGGSPAPTPGGARAPAPAPAPAGQSATRPQASGETIDLERRRDQLKARVAELQWDLGGLVYEMAIRDRMRVDVLVKRAAILQDADAELNEVERILRMEQTGTAGVCSNCGAPHANGAVFCWQCGQPLLEQVSGDSIGRDSIAGTPRRR